MKKITKILINYYFTKFRLINLFVLFFLILSRFVLTQEYHILLVYILMLFGLAVYAQVNFELLRPYAGTGATLYIFWVLRIVLVYMLTNKIGVCANIDDVTLKTYLDFLTNNWTIELINALGTLGIFFLIYDMYIGIKKIKENLINVQ